MESETRENAALGRVFLSDVAVGDTDAIGFLLGHDAVDHQSGFTGEPKSAWVSPTWWQALVAADLDVVTEDDVVAADRWPSGNGLRRPPRIAAGLDVDRPIVRDHVRVVLSDRGRHVAEIWPSLDGSSDSWMASQTSPHTALC